MPNDLHVQNGEVWRDGRKLTNLGNVTEASLSPDGQMIILIRRDQKVRDESVPDRDRDSLWLMNGLVAQPHQILHWHEDWRDLKKNLTGLTSPVWSPDGRFVYVLSSAWATSWAVHQVEIPSGRETFVIDGADLKVIQDGPYRGMLLVSRHTCHQAPGCDYPWSIVRPDGSTVLTIPGSAQGDGEAVVTRWLHAHHWAAR